MSASNLIVGSTSGLVYIVRCEPSSRTVSIKSTITAGKAPLALIIDVDNKCFYCLDNCPEEAEGRLLTLVPSNFGTIEEKTAIGTGGCKPFHMMNHGKNIYVCHEGGYSTIKSPLPSKSTRRGRASELTPVAENTVAESLDELYQISKTMDTEDAPDPAQALNNIKQYLDAETQLEITELKQFVPTQETVLKFIRTQNDSFLIGITKTGASSYSVMNDGTLVMEKTLQLDGVVDCAVARECLYMLTKEQIVKARLDANGQLETLSAYPCPYDGLKSITVSHRHAIAFISTTNFVLSMKLNSGNLTKLDIQADTLCLSKNEQFLFTSNRKQNTLTVFSLQGQNLGSCSVQDPAEIVHMS